MSAGGRPTEIPPSSPPLPAPTCPGGRDEEETWREGDGLEKGLKESGIGAEQRKWEGRKEKYARQTQNNIKDSLHFPFL